MSTTTIRLPVELKTRIANAAQRAGVSSHNFILQALAERIEQEERRADFEVLAETRYARILTDGETIPWQEMRSYLQQRASGIQASRPRAVKSAR